MSIKTDLRHAQRRTFERLAALRDETKLQLHLLSLDARKTWNELEKEILALEERSERDGEKATEALKDAARGLAGRLSDFLTSQLNHSAGLLTSVRSLMTAHVCTCGPDDSLSRAAQLMWDADCGAIPVVVDQKVAGVITDRDICMATYTQGKAPSELRVAVAMSREPFSCHPDDSLADALAMMADKRVRRLPVLSADGKPLGVLAFADVARWARAVASPAVATALVEALAAISATSPQKMTIAAE